MSEAKYRSFPGVVCQRLRNLVDVRTKAEVHRKKLFDRRDQLEEEIHELGKRGKGSEVQDLKAQCFDVIKEIDKDRKTINWCNGEISEAVEKADEPKLWSTSDVEVPSFDDDDDDEEADDPDQATIGRPGTPTPVRGKKSAAKIAGTEQPEGRNQHLEADLNELDCNDKVKGKLRQAGFNTIGDVWAHAIRDGKPLAMVVDAGENVTAAAMRALKAYLKDHTRADLEATKDGRGGAA